MKALGLQVKLVEGGMHLLKALETEPFDLVLLDCHMPVMDGFEVAAKIREREASLGYYASGHALWVVAATAFAFEEDKERCLEAGMDDFLSKPAKVKDIEAMLERYFEAKAK